MLNLSRPFPIAVLSSQVCSDIPLCCLDIFELKFSARSFQPTLNEDPTRSEEPEKDKKNRELGSDDSGHSENCATFDLSRVHPVAHHCQSKDYQILNCAATSMYKNLSPAQLRLTLQGEKKQSCLKFWKADLCPHSLKHLQLPAQTPQTTKYRFPQHFQSQQLLVWLMMKTTALLPVC